MREWWRKWGWVGAFTVPFVVASVFFIVATPHSWPGRFGEVQELGMIVGAVCGFLLFPRMGWTAKCLLFILYIPMMLGALFIFGLLFPGFFHDGFA